jgi:cytochrome c peroxidase
MRTTRVPRPRLAIACVGIAAALGSWPTAAPAARNPTQATPSTPEPARESEATKRSQEAGLGRTEISPEVPKDRQSPHGALNMDEQERAFAKLQAPPARQAFARVDPALLSFVVPKDNQTTPERVALGQKLYFDVRLSSDGTVACATCHDVSRGFTDQRPTSEGVKNQLGQRNAPTTLNALWMQTQFLDGRSRTLEDQAKLPIVNPIEMGQPNGDAAVAGIAGDPEYARMFQAAYGRPPNYEDAARAIAAFERTLVFVDSPFLRYVAGDPKALSEQEVRGFQLYNGKARCVSCHQLSPSNPIGSDGRFHNIGVAARTQNFEAMARQALALLGTEGRDEEAVDKLAIQSNLSELGRFMVSKDRSDIGAFKTLQVANAGVTAPYMHDGSMRTLWDVMDHYNKGGEANPYLDGGIEPLDLTEAEIDDVVAFLFALTDERFADENRREFEAQRRIAKDEKRRPFRDEKLATRKVLLFQQRVMGQQGLGEKEGP